MTDKPKKEGEKKTAGPKPKKAAGAKKDENKPAEKKVEKKLEVRDYLKLFAPSKAGYGFKYFKMESGE